MGRWTPDEHGCIYDEAGCFARLTPNKAERLATRHNADIDALTDERDELQRRLDDILGECCGARDVCARTIVAIAEGREG